MTVVQLGGSDCRPSPPTGSSPGGASVVPWPLPGPGTPLPLVDRSGCGQAEGSAAREPAFGPVQSSNTAPYSQIGNARPTIDWLTVVQDHPGKLPILGSALLLFCDPASGDIESQAVKSHAFEGSFDSRIMVRCDGRRVEVSGNPSRWGVPHSLDGFRDVGDAMALYNRILGQLGLPEFSEVERSYIAPMLLQRSGPNAIAKEGARITRIDLAFLYETGGSENAAIVVRALGQVTHAGKVPMVYGNGQTVAWGTGSRHVYIKYYSKGPELLRHGGPDALPAANWATAVGLVRHEVTFKGMWLAKNGLERPSVWSGEVMRRVLDQYSIHERLGVSRTSYHRIYEELLALGLPRGRAQRAQEAALAYLSGHVFRRGHNIPRQSFYRLRKDLRLVGLDISSPLNVSALRYSVRVVEMLPACLPEGLRRVG